MQAEIIQVDKVMVSEETERRFNQSEQKQLTYDTFDSYQYNPNHKIEITGLFDDDTVQYEDLAEQIINVQVTKVIDNGSDSMRNLE